MPFTIVKKNITKIRCDAIVNPTNEDLIPLGGADAEIHQVAGKELDEMCRSIGKLGVGKAKITPAYRLPCKYVIHTVGPRWRGGGYYEKELLQSCYQEALKIAKGTKCKSVAFPLISSGLHGYPKNEVLKVALSVIKEFLYENDMRVYLVLFDKEEYALNEKTVQEIAEYIKEEYEEIREDDLPFETYCIEKSLSPCGFEERLESAKRLIAYSRKKFVSDYLSCENIFEDMYDGFALSLMQLIDAKGMGDVECYKKANVSRQTWYKILNDPNYKPNKKTILSFAIALELDIEETQKLLATAGFVLSKSSKFDLIIMYCIKKEIYDVFEIDSILFQYDQETLASKL